MVNTNDFLKKTYKVRLYYELEDCNPCCWSGNKDEIQDSKGTA